MTSIITAVLSKANATFSFTFEITKTTSEDILREIQVAANAYFMAEVNTNYQYSLSPLEFAVLHIYTPAA